MSLDRVSERALVLAPHGRDARVATLMLSEAGIAASVMANVAELTSELGRGAGFAIVTEEALRTSDISGLAKWLESQEEWSDFPFILLTTRGGGLERNPAAARFLSVLGNVTFLERPFHPTTLVSLAQAALRGRRRQYDARLRLQDLREGEERYRSLFDSIEAGFCIIEMVFDERHRAIDYRFVETNPAFVRQTGLVDAVGRTVRSLTPDHEQHWFDVYGRVALTGEAIRFENEAASLGRYYEVYAFPTGEPGDGRVAILFNDISDRRATEEELRDLTASLERRVEEATGEREKALAQLHEAQKLETLGQLTGGVAHDFNNLLTPITGALDLLMRRFGSTDPRAGRLITNAIDAAERAKLLVQRLLGFARRQILETRPTDVRALIENMRDLIRSSVGPDVELTVELAKAVYGMVDPNQLELAILNLCVNARDAMPDGGRLTIVLDEIDITQGEVIGTAPGRYISLVVLDTGQGMDGETLARAVEPFYSTKVVGKGTGLGLSMVHGLALQLGGGLRIASEHGVGTTIEMLLPIAQQIEAEPEPVSDAPSEKAAPPAVLDILLVDDEPVIRSSVGEMLREIGHNVMEAGSGEEAISHFRDRRSDLVITDYKMPGMSGDRLAREIRRLAPGLGILIITGYSGESSSLGFPTLPKPFRRRDLEMAIELTMHASPGA